MIEKALISLLWDKNAVVLENYLVNKKRTVIAPAMCCTPDIRSAVEQVGSILLPLESVLSKEEINTLRLDAQKRAAVCHQHFQGGAWSDFCTDHAIDAQGAAAILSAGLAEKLLPEMAMLTALDKVKQRYSIELTVLNEDVLSISKTIGMWSQNCGIPVVQLLHAGGVGRNYTVHEGLNSSDVLAVYGKRDAEGYLDDGVPEQQLRVTGCPSWDIYAHLLPKKELVRRYLCDQQNLLTDVPIVLFGTTWAANLTAASDSRIFEKSLYSVFRSFKQAIDSGLPLQLVVKDRPSNAAFGAEVVQRIAMETGVHSLNFRYVKNETEMWVTAADLLISVDSNLSIEASFVGVPAINLMSEQGLLLGPRFYGDSGIVEVEASALANAIIILLTDDALRNTLKAAMQSKIEEYNIGFQGDATGRMVALMEEMALYQSGKSENEQVKSILNGMKQPPLPDGQYVWQRLQMGDNSTQIMDEYSDIPRVELVGLFVHPPRRVVDIGCNMGATGALIKQHYPDAEVLGVEMNQAAAAIASKRIDRVINASIDSLDWEAHGIAPHSVDTVVLADVLEHLYDPWVVLVNLKKILTPDAQILASIPNVRNLWLMDQLAQGRWPYAQVGLLDITHIRFFTMDEMKHLFTETGYDIKRLVANHDGSVVLQGNPQGDFDISTEKLVLKGVTPQEALELQALQIFIVAHPNVHVQTGQELELVPTEYAQNQAQAIPVAKIVTDYDDDKFALVSRNNAKLLERGVHEIIPSGEAGTKSSSEETLGLKEFWKLSYQTWINKHSLQEIDAQLLAERMILKWQTRPSVHLVMPVQPGEQGWLADTIDSLGSQMYQNWQLTVVAAFPSPDPIFEQLQELQWIETSSDASPAEAVNHAISSRMADWVAFVKPGIRFEPHYLLACADYINVRPQWKLIYTDSDSIDANNERVDPEFKPDFNLDMLRSTAYMGQILVNRDALMKAGGTSGLAGAESYDLALRVLDYFGELSIGHISDVLYHLPQLNTQEFNEQNGREALKQHLQRNEIRADVTEGYLPNTYRVIYEHEQVPLVSIIIPTKDKLEFFQPCITSLLEKTTYANYEVIVVDNQSTDPDVLEYYSELRINHADKIKILEYPHSFNFSAICNFAAAEAAGAYLLLLNNDTQIIQDDWLDRMVSYGQRKDVGIVGARLIYPETGKIQHAGVVLGMTGPADHPFNGILSIDEPGYMGRALIDQNYSAVTAACLLIRASVYKQVGGMDDVRLKVLFNDVDLCLKVGELGYKIIWTPYVTAVHYGSTSINSSVVDYEKLALSLARAKQEREAMFERWLPKLANDPAYNRHLSLVRTDYQVESNVVIDWDTNFHDCPRILGIPLSGGSGEYRVISPFKALGYAGLAQCCIIQSAEYHKTRVLTVVELERAKPDTLLVQAAITDIQLEALRQHSKFNKEVFKVFALDDLINNPPPKSSFARFAFKDAKPRLRAALAECDRLIVTTQPLADLCASMIEDIRVIPNYLSDKLWGDLVSQRRQGKKPRVGWAGGQQHQGDLSLIVSVVKETAHEVDWVFFGMCLDELKPYVKEIHDFVVSVDDYPAKLASLNLDLAVAPLEMHPFNEAKSNLRLLEYGILGWPVVCTDILPYQDAPVKRVPNDPNAWIEAIRERIDDLDAAAREGAVLRQWVLENYMLENHIADWLSALTR